MDTALPRFDATFPKRVDIEAWGSGMLLNRRPLDDREFSTVRGGYEKEQVKAYLADLEARLSEFERWANETMLRLRSAEERARLRDAIEAVVVAAPDRGTQSLAQSQAQAVNSPREQTDS